MRGGPRDPGAGARKDHLGAGGRARALGNVGRQVAATQASYDSRMAKANAQLEEWEKKYKADTGAKVKTEREALVKDRREKLKF